MKTRKVTFTLSPVVIQEATAAIVLGDFNNWEPHEAYYLQRQDDGSFALDIDILPGQYQYRYYLNDGRWADDDAPKVRSEFYGNEVNNCLLVVEEIALSAPEAQDKVVKKVTSKKSAPKKNTVKPNADFTKIPGITKAVETLLVKAGIDTYSKLRKASQPKLKEVLTAGGDKFAKANPENWPKAAKLAAEEKWDEVALLKPKAKKKK